MLLQDRVILVTGAGRGIGRGVVEAVAEEGGDVVVTDIDAAAAHELAGGVEAGGRQALALVVDVTDTTAVDEAVTAVLETFGRLDGLVNNAGVLAMGAALDSRNDDWRRQFEVNLQGVVTCCLAVARAMKTRGGGAIVNVASNAGKVGYPHMAAYNASKAAVISLTRSLAAEWAGDGINVNAVCPGGVDTPMLAGAAEWIGDREGKNAREVLATMVPVQLGRHIRPIEVGRVVAFLLSPRAQIIRGQAINVDGGDTPY